MASAPRILVIDPTPIGSLCATGQFKQMLLEKWPRHTILELTTNMDTGQTVLRSALGPLQAYRSVAETLELIREFGPDVIYVRPEPAEFRHMDFLLSALGELPQPAILHIMDDWVAGDAAPTEHSRKAVARVARYIADRASLRYTDGPAYVADFEERLGSPFENLLNGVDLDLWKGPPPPWDDAQPFTLTHMGNYDPTMSRQAVIDIAQAVESLRPEFDIGFDVYLRGYIFEVARKELAAYRSTRVLRQESDFREYVAALRRSDVNVYAYNQDPRSVQYMGKGIPNKTCELMAAGKPILAYGSKIFAGVTYLGDHKAARVVSAREDLAKAIRDLRASPSEARELVANADKLMRERHDAAKIRVRFLDDLKKVVATRDCGSPPPFAGAKHDWWDVLRPALLDQRLRRARAEKLRKAAAAIPRLAVHSVLWLRTKPLACATVAILASLMAIVQGPQQIVLAGAVMAGLTWMASQAGLRFVEVLGDRILNPEGLKHQAIKRLSAAYAAPWAFLFALAAGALAGRYLWDRGWLAVAGAGVLATLVAFVAIAAMAYPRVLADWRRATAT